MVTDLLSGSDFSEVFTPFEGYDLLLVVLGLAVLATMVLPRLFSNKPFTMPMVLLGGGFAVFALPLGLNPPNPLEQGGLAERLTEFGVIVALMSAGLKLDRPPGWRAWLSTWLLLGITMPLTIAGAALLGWWALGFVPATALLLGAVSAPTDPVLATEVQVGAPGAGYEHREVTGQEEDEVRFSLTSEAGLNDGLAFPFIYAALAMAVAGPTPSNWIGSWLLVGVFYKIGMGVVLGLVLGRLLALSLLRVHVFAVQAETPAKRELSKAITGFGSLAATLLVYGATEYAGAYGFIAVFVAACAMRNYERDHEYVESLHVFAEQAELLLTIGILIALGGAIAGGLLAPLTWSAALVGLALIFLVRPVAGVVGLLGRRDVPWRERATISFFGIRGVGSLYYLSYALNKAEFAGAETLWALVTFVIVGSVVVHGVSGAPIMNALERRKIRHREA